MSYGVGIDGKAWDAGVHPNRLGKQPDYPWDNPVGYEAGKAVELTPEELRALRSKQAWAEQRERTARDAPKIQSEVDRALGEQSDKIERLAHVISALASRLSPVLADSVPSPNPEACQACQPYSVPVARAIDARTCNLATLIDELIGLNERLGV